MTGVDWLVTVREVNFLGSWRILLVQYVTCVGKAALSRIRRDVPGGGEGKHVSDFCGAELNGARVDKRQGDHSLASCPHHASQNAFEKLFA